MTTPEIICAGMIVVDVIVDGLEAIPRPGETGRVSSVTLASGGDAINEAIALAKLGNKVGLMGIVGQDSQGQFIKDRCAHYGVSTEGLFADSERSTTTSIVLLDKSGERSFLSERTASIAAYGPEHVDLDLIRPGLKALSIGSIFTSKPFDTKALAPLLKKAKSVGAITVADMVMDQQGYGLDGLAEAWPYLDYVVPSELEAQIFTGTTDPRSVAEDFRKRGVKNVILKRGSNGVVAFSGAEEVTCSAFEVPVVDTTGAGDNFVGGLIHCLVQKLPLAETLRFASATAALSVQAVGAGAGLKDLAQVEHFLAEQGERA